MVQLPLETSKQSRETVPPGDGPAAAWDSEGDPEFYGQGSTGSNFLFFFFLMLVKKKRRKSLNLVKGK